MRIKELLPEYRVGKGVDRIDHSEFAIYRNPAAIEYSNLLRQARMPALRGWLGADDLLCWDAEHIHDEVQRSQDKFVDAFLTRQRPPYPIRVELERDRVLVDGKAAPAGLLEVVREHPRLKVLFGPVVPVEIY